MAKQLWAVSKDARRKLATRGSPNRTNGSVVFIVHLGTTLTNQNSIQEEIKSRLELGNAYYSAESSVIQVAVQKFKDQDILNYNSARCPVWV